MNAHVKMNAVFFIVVVVACKRATMQNKNDTHSFDTASIEFLISKKKLSDSLCLCALCHEVECSRSIGVHAGRCYWQCCCCC